MDLTAIIKELVEERELVERAIATLERIAAQHGRRRGRPPAWMALVAQDRNQPKKRGRPRKSQPK